MRRVPGRTGYDAPVAVVPGRAAFIQAKVTVMEQASFVSRVARGQWSFFWAGIVFGIAQIIYMATLWIQVWQAGGVAESTPITVTTDLGKMFRAMEMFLYRLFGLPDFQLYGNSVDGIASGGAVVPGVGWPIVGMVVGGYFVARLERENRTWVRYSPRILAISFFGGVLFSYGTRLAGVGIIRCAGLESRCAGSGREGSIGPTRPVLGRTRSARARLALLTIRCQPKGMVLAGKLRGNSLPPDRPAGADGSTRLLLLISSDKRTSRTWQGWQPRGVTHRVQGDFREDRLHAARPARRHPRARAARGRLRQTFPPAQAGATPGWGRHRAAALGSGDL